MSASGRRPAARPPPGVTSEATGAEDSGKIPNRCAEAPEGAIRCPKSSPPRIRPRRRPGTARGPEGDEHTLSRPPASSASRSSSAFSSPTLSTSVFSAEPAVTDFSSSAFLSERFSSAESTWGRAVRRVLLAAGHGRLRVHRLGRHGPCGVVVRLRRGHAAESGKTAGSAPAESGAVSSTTSGTTSDTASDTVSNTVSDPVSDTMTMEAVVTDTAVSEPSADGLDDATPRGGRRPGRGPAAGVVRLGHRVSAGGCPVARARDTRPGRAPSHPAERPAPAGRRVRRRGGEGGARRRYRHRDRLRRGARRCARRRGRGRAGRPRWRRWPPPW